MKRFFDILVSTLFLVLLSPLYLLLAFCGLLFQGSPVLFAQERPGKKGRVFRIWKFRTMRAGEGSDFQRLTSWGRFLRATTLDELPQLWNVLHGEMSLVGPRPLLVEYLPLYTPDQFRRHEVSPGMTGWAQVKGRNSLTWEERFELDIWYIENQSFILDLKIILLTFVAILLRKGVNQSGSKTMEKFQGSVD